MCPFQFGGIKVEIKTNLSVLNSEGCEAYGNTGCKQLGIVILMVLLRGILMKKTCLHCHVNYYISMY